MKFLLLVAVLLVATIYTNQSFAKPNKSGVAFKVKPPQKRALKYNNPAANLKRRRHRHRVLLNETPEIEEDLIDKGNTLAMAQSKKKNKLPPDLKKKVQKKMTISLAKLQLMFKEELDALLSNKDIIPAILW